ncbi:hypothetical protein F5884DRAFT_686798, partial [Xylogone sp. PMI_703]
GCETWVWLQIAEITALLSWKNNSQRLSILSMRELTQRAMVIEKKLLPEIQLSVSKTLAALKELRDPQLIKSLAWPFCVTGCLAQKTDYTAIKNLLTSAGISPEGLGNLWSAFCIIEECWRLRECEQGLWEWRGVMARLNEHVFLV